MSKVFTGKILDGLFLKYPRKIPITEMAIKLLGLILVHVSKWTSAFTRTVRKYLLKVNNKDTRTRFRDVQTYLFKVSKSNARKIGEICSQLTVKTPEWNHWCCSGIFVVFFLTYFKPFSNASIVNFEHIFACWFALVSSPSTLNWNLFVWW